MGQRLRQPLTQPCPERGQTGFDAIAFVKYEGGLLFGFDAFS
jgi:hypothetical protein